MNSCKWDEPTGNTSDQEQIHPHRRIKNSVPPSTNRQDQNDSSRIQTQTLCREYEKATFGGLGASNGPGGTVRKPPPVGLAPRMDQAGLCESHLRWAWRLEWARRDYENATFGGLSASSGPEGFADLSSRAMFIHLFRTKRC